MQPQIENWFRYIEKQEPIKTKFDLYYLCLMMGFATGKTAKPTAATDLVANFVQDYKSSQRLIVGLLIVAELRNLGVELNDKSEVQIQIKRLLDPHHPANLTEEGFNCMNAYAYGGFNYLAAELKEEPRRVEEFLPMYKKLLKEAASNRQ